MKMKKGAIADTDTVEVGDSSLVFLLAVLLSSNRASSVAIA